MEVDGVFQLIYMGAGGRWYLPGTTTPAPFPLQHGKGYFYLNRGTTFVWRAEAAL